MITRKDVINPPSTGPQPPAFASSPAPMRFERRWWPFTDTVGEQNRVDTGRDANSGNSIGSTSRPLPWAMSGDRHLPFRWRSGSGGSNFVGHVSNIAIVKRSSDPVVIDEAPDAQQLEVYLVFTLSPRSIQRTHVSRNIVYVRSIQRQKNVEARVSATPADDACRKRPLPEAQDSTPDLQLSLSPTTAAVDAKKRKTSTAAGEREIVDSSELSISLSLSPPAAASMQQQQHRPKETTRGSTSRSGEAVLGQSTLDLTMSIRALE